MGKHAPRVIDLRLMNVEVSRVDRVRKPKDTDVPPFHAHPHALPVGYHDAGPPAGLIRQADASLARLRRVEFGRHGNLAAADSHRSAERSTRLVRFQRRRHLTRVLVERADVPVRADTAPVTFVGGSATRASSGRHARANRDGLRSAIRGRRASVVRS